MATTSPPRLLLSGRKLWALLWSWVTFYYFIGGDRYEIYFSTLSI